MKVGYIQNSPVFGEKEINFAQIEEATKIVKADLIVLPELFATGYYKWKGVERRGLCHNPVINGNNTLQPPKGAEKYTLCYFLLSRRPQTEKDSVNRVLKLFILSGLLALLVYFFDILI